MNTVTFKGWIGNGDLTWDEQELRASDFLWIWRKPQAKLDNLIPVVVTISSGGREQNLAPLLVRRGPDGRFVKRNCGKAK